MIYILRSSFVNSVFLFDFVAMILENFAAKNLKAICNTYSKFSEVFLTPSYAHARTGIRGYKMSHFQTILRIY